MWVNDLDHFCKVLKEIEADEEDEKARMPADKAAGGNKKKKVRKPRPTIDEDKLDSQEKKGKNKLDS